jgi:hypothetical protein
MTSTGQKELRSARCRGALLRPRTRAPQCPARPLNAAYGDVVRIGAGSEDVPASGGLTCFGLFECLEIMPAARAVPNHAADSAGH